MTSDGPSWFLKIEVELSTGRSFRSSLTRRDTEGLAKGFVVQEDQPDADLGLIRAAYTTLAMRVEKRAGGLVLPDADGRLWYFHASHIAAFGFQHRLDVPDAVPVIPVGFREPDMKT